MTDHKDKFDKPSDKSSKSADEPKDTKEANPDAEPLRDTNFGDEPKSDKPKERDPGADVYDPATNPNIQDQPTNVGNTVAMTATDVITNAQAIAAGQEPPVEPPKNVGSSSAAGYLSPENAAAQFGGETVKMNFPNAITYLNTDKGIVAYPQGIHNVPAEIADHAYLKSNGATRVAEPPVTKVDAAQPGYAPKTAQPGKK